MIRVNIAKNPAKFNYDIYVLNRGEDTTEDATIYDGQTGEWKSLDRPYPPSFSIPTYIFEEMVKESKGVVPEDVSDVKKALEDTKVVRDRLLTLIERTHG